MEFLASLHEVVYGYGGTSLFEGLSLTLRTGERLGVIGPNGVGKSTLLRLLSGELVPDRGVLARRPGLRCLRLSQHDELPPEVTIETWARQAFAPLGLEEGEQEVRARQVLTRAGFERTERRIRELSGGWRRRLALSLALGLEPELLLLDEPTNHLDLPTIVWLEQVLVTSGLSFVLVTHDREFLDRTVSAVLELDRVHPGGYLRTEGGYTTFVQRRTEALETAQRQELALAGRVERETEWLRRGPKARTSKARYRIDEAHRLQEELEELRTVRRQRGETLAEFSGTGNRSALLVRLHHLGHTYGNKILFQDLNVRVQRGMRLGVLGRNGSGKSTLLAILSGAVEPTQGHVEWKDGLRKVLFEQERETLDPQLSLRRALAPDGDQVVFRGKSQHVASWAKAFAFEAARLDVPLHALSGGERARVSLARIMLEEVDLLLLDEPTNDLDLLTLAVLEERLEDFPGAVVLVSHDRAFLDRLATSVLGFLDEGTIGSFADCAQWLEALASTERKVRKAKEVVDRPRQKTRLGYRDQLELDGMEARLAAAEETLAKVRLKLQDPEVLSAADTLVALCTEEAAAREEVERLYLRWQELETLRQQLAGE